MNLSLLIAIVGFIIFYSKAEEMRKEESVPLKNLATDIPNLEIERHFNISHGSGIQEKIIGAEDGIKRDSSITRREEKEVEPHKSDEVLRLLNRDADTYYDNDLIMKVSDSNGDLPSSLYLEPNIRDPVIMSKEPNNNHQEFAMIQKRQAEKSYDYTYDDDLLDEDYSAIKGNLLGNKKSRLSKIFRTKNKNTTALNETKQSESAEQETPKHEKDNLEKKSATESEEVAGVQDTRQAHSNSLHDETNDEPHSDLAKVWSESGKSKRLKANKNTRAASVRKAKSPSCVKEAAPKEENCLPTWGAPKNPSISFYPKKLNDSEYEKVIKGDLIDKLVKTIFEKVSKNKKMTNELGIYPVDFKDVRDEYDQIRNNSNGCCMKVVNELQCFLSWILSLEASRFKRSIIEERECQSSEAYSRKTDTSGNNPGIVSSHEPSPEYLKLYDKVEQYRANSMDNWDMNAILPA